MEKSVVTFDKGTTCSSWNYCGERLATGSINGALAIFDSVDPASSSFTCTSTSRVHEVSIVKVVWVPPEYGGGVACICADGTLSLWEEVAEDTKPLQWKLCKGFETSSNQVLDMQFGVSFTSSKLAEFQNVIDSVSKFGKAACLSASISWTPQRGESQQLSFVLGFNLNVMQLNSAKVPQIGPFEEETVQLQCPVPEPQSPANLKEADHQSPVSVLEAQFVEDVNVISLGSECFGRVNVDLHGLRMQLKLLKMESGANANGLMLTASDKDGGQGFVSVSEDNEIFNDESWEFFHLIDVLIDSGYDDADLDTFVSTWYSRLFYGPLFI